MNTHNTSSADEFRKADIDGIINCTGWRIGMGHYVLEPGYTIFGLPAGELITPGSAEMKNGNPFVDWHDQPANRECVCMRRVPDGDEVVKVAELIFNHSCLHERCRILIRKDLMEAMYYHLIISHHLTEPQENTLRLALRFCVAPDNHGIDPFLDADGVLQVSGFFRLYNDDDELCMDDERESWSGRDH